MVLLFEKIGRSLKYPSKLENPSSHDAEALSASLEAFRSDVSKILSQMMLEVKPGLDFLSLAWIQKCLEMMPMINKAFAKLAVDIDYPMSKWEAAASEEYLSYSLNVLELLNKVNSSISHLSHAWVSLSHGLSLFEKSPTLASKHLQEIQPKDLSMDIKIEGEKQDKEKLVSCKVSIIHEALLIVKTTGLLLFGIIISGLCSHVKPYFEVRKLAGKLHDLSLKSLDSSLSKEMMNCCIVKEVKEVNKAAAELAAGIAHLKGDDAVKELSTKLEVLDRFLQSLGKQTDHLFSEVLAARNKLLYTVRHKLDNKS